MEDRSHALIAIGFLVVFGLGAVAVVWWMLAPGAVRVPYVLESKSSVAGLGPGSTVQFNGVDVGVVKNIHIDRATHRSIQVLIMVDKKFPLPQGTKATVGSSSLVGPTVVDLQLGSSSRIIQTSAEHPAHLPVEAGGLSAMMDQAKKIIGDVQQTLKSARDVLSPQNRRQISDTLSNLRKASAHLVQLEKTIEPGAKELPGLIAQTRATIASAKDLAANANTLVAKAQQPMDSIGQAASSTAAFTTQLNQQTAPQLNALLVSLSTLVTRLNALSAELQQTPQSLILGPAKPKPGPGETPPPAQKNGG
ncbi:MAG: MlaD family protein [Gammaproteobacteria bacterium]